MSSVSMGLDINMARQVSPSTFSIKRVNDVNNNSRMSDYKQLVRMMFNSWFKTHELSAMIVDQQIRRNNIKRLEGNYRRFQHEIEYRYKPQEEVDRGLLKYHHQLAETQYRSILLLNHQLANKSFKLNPYLRRQQNFQLNRQHRSKIDFSEFANNNSQ